MTNPRPSELIAPGEGPTCGVSVSFHAGTIGAVRQRVGTRGVSPYIEAAVQRQLQRDNLTELITSAEAEHGQLTQDEIDAAAERLDAAIRSVGTA